MAIKLADLAKIKNLGEKSIKIIQSALAKKGVNWQPGEKK